MTYHGSVLVFNIEDPARPVRTASGRTIAGGGLQPDGHPDYSDTNYALAFSADGHTLTVIANSAPSMPGPVPARPSAGPAISRWSLTDTGAAAPVAVRDGTGAAAGSPSPPAGAP